MERDYQIVTGNSAIVSQTGGGLVHTILMVAESPDWVPGNMCRAPRFMADKVLCPGQVVTECVFAQMRKIMGQTTPLSAHQDGGTQTANKTVMTGKVCMSPCTAWWCTYPCSARSKRHGEADMSCRRLVQKCPE